MNRLRKNQTPVAVEAEIADAVLAGLNAIPKSLPPWLFYDEAGSALFEKITGLPEYYLTRTEQGILSTHATEILQAAGEGLTLIELGAGTAAKTRILIEALLRRQLGAKFYPIDVSQSSLEIAQQHLIRQFPTLKVVPLLGDYTHANGLSRLRQIPGRKLVLYIGSSIGNFEPDAAGKLLETIRQALAPGDALLLGTDMVKDAEILHRAYNDAQGTTADFNLNLLARINRELGGNFDLDTFNHTAEWNPNEQRIEMYLESLCHQDVEIDDLETSFYFAAGERIHTENSYKFTGERVQDILSRGGFILEKTWTDSHNWFGVHLARVR